MQSTLPDVHIEQYEGPYDLLVELAKKQHVQLSTISLKDLTDSFLKYIDAHTIDPEILGSFLLVASTLLLIKVRQIIPFSSAEDEEITNFQERLVEYQQYRILAEHMQNIWGKAPLLPAHYFAEGTFTERPMLPMPTITLEQLDDALQNLLGRIPEVPKVTKHLVQRGRSLKQILELFQERLLKANKILFHETVHGTSRQEQAVSFLAVLEMARNQTVQLEQRKAFGELTIHSI